MWRSGVLAIAAAMAAAGPVRAEVFNPFGDLHTTRAAQQEMRQRAARSGQASAMPFQIPGDDDAIQQAPGMLDGGDRPSISPIAPASVPFRGPYAPGQIVIDTHGRQLFLVQSGGMALRYPISVGREGFTWTGTQTISRVANWPDWRPPVEMRQRDPRLPEVMTGGVRNPLGAKALYLGSTLYRIHGTNDARTIGLAASSGCFRMMNGHVIDLASRVGVGTTVTVLSHLPAGTTRTASQAVNGRPPRGG